MRLATKTYYITGSFAVLFIIMGSIGFWGIKNLVSVLDYIVGPAWSTADGAMEGTIGLQAQVLYTNQYLTGDNSAKEKITEAIDTANSAIGRLKAAKIIGINDIKKLAGFQKRYGDNRIAVMDSYDKFQVSLKTFKDNTSLFVELGEVLEERGDGAIEELVKNPNKRISWNNGLQNKWQAADGGMEANIALLSTLYHIERYIGGGPSTDILTDINDAISFQHEASEEMLSTGHFDIPAPSFYKGKTMKQAYLELFTNHQAFITELLANYDQYYQYYMAYLASSVELLDFMEEFEEKGDSAVEGQSEIVTSTETTAMSLTLITLVVGLGLVGFIGFIMTRLIIYPLRKIIHSVHNIAQGDGDLTKKTNITTDDEIGELSTNIDLFISQLHGIVQETHAASSEIKNTIESSNENTYKIGADIQDIHGLSNEVAVANEEMSNTATSIAENCAQASTSADSVTMLTSHGQEVVSSVASGMQVVVNNVADSSAKISSLKEQADKIGQIISVIEGISEQTNLLALNAAIEAARAGEQGRGFAVVADEVRTLAKRTADSTHEISEVIGRIQQDTNSAFQSMSTCEQDVSSNNELSVKAGEALEEINKNISELTSMINQVAVAAEQQSVTINEINEKSHNIATKVENISEGSEQSKVLASEMNESTEHVTQALSKFKL